MPFWKRRRVEKPHPVYRPRGIAFGLARDIGQVRTSNQDQVFGLLSSLPSMGRQLVLGLFIVADGMGGHRQGEVASQRAVEIVADHILEGLLMPVLREEPPEAIQNLLQEALQTANRTILEEARLQGSDMGTTLTAALLVGEQVYVAHVGDSRLYTYGETGLRCHTRDHSMVARLLELGQITEEEAVGHPRRNYLYQSIGQQEEIEPEVSSFPAEGCTHLLLCSDGLWGVAGEEALVEALTRGEEPQAICERLVERANKAGGEDNISVIVVAFPPRGTPDD